MCIILMSLETLLSNTTLPTYLPPHEDIICVFQCVIVEIVLVEGFGILIEWQELTL